MKIVFGLLLCLPVLVYGQHYKANYLCDFENSDCGFHAQPDTGAYFSRGKINIGKRKTNALVLGDLPNSPAWRGQTRTAFARSPAIFPGWLFGKVTVAMDYFLVDRNCVDYLQLGQLMDNGTRVLVRTQKKNEWKTIKTTIQETDQPVQLVVEAHLHPNCVDKEACQCSGSAVVDNLRITSPDMSTTVLDQANRASEGQPQTDPELTLNTVEAAFNEMRVHNRRAVNDDDPFLEDDSPGVMTSPQRLLPPYRKNIPERPPCPAPHCNYTFVYPHDCGGWGVGIHCVYIRHCHCNTHTTCTVTKCPVVEACPEPLPCPPTPHPPDAKTWHSQHYRPGHVDPYPGPYLPQEVEREI